MEDLARIVLAIDSGEVAEEVMHFLDRAGSARVVAAASDRRQLADAIRQLEPDVVVASPALAPARSGSSGPALLAVDTVETVRSLRRALDAGARGFFLWPAERDQLARAAARLHSASAAPAGGERGRVVAVCGPRGGVGATFLAAHLAAAVAERERCVLADLDLAYADLSAALGAPEGDGVRTIADLIPLGSDVGSADVRAALWPHPAGFEVLLAPPEGPPARDGSPVGAVVSALAAGPGTVLLHLPRYPNAAVRVGLAAAERVLMVVTLDVASLRAAKRLVSDSDLDERCWFVVNRATRSSVTPGDVERVFGRPPVAVIPASRAVAQAQDRGRLVPLRGRTGRAVRRLAERLLKDVA